MPLTFLAPLFLAGFAALAVPVIIHLTRRQKKQVVEFASLMFLRQIPYQSVRRRWIRNWPLFLLRCAAIVILAAAFARPFLDQPGAAASPLATAREVVILLDRSYSMGYGDRWARALAAAREAIAGLGLEDRASLVFFAAGAAVAHPPTADRARLRAALDTVRVSSGTTRYGPALKLAQSTLEGSELPRREVVL
ncbi:MAG TPA: BatA domain-containing protein, partial [Longimicrobiaceae bacterium]|nr:BatA domain-containing protein [Longimicrobiaceae bacterium]